MGKVTKEDKRTITPEFRVAFPHVFEAHSAFEGQELKFSLVMLFDKNRDLTGLKGIVGAALRERWGEDKAKHPKMLRLPFRNGDDKPDLQGYENTIYCTATSKQPPGVVNRDKSPMVADDNEFYAGCYARAEIMAFAYDTAGNKGVGLALQNVQKIRDGESFQGRRKAQDVFDTIEDNSEKEENYEDLSALGV